MSDSDISKNLSLRVMQFPQHLIVQNLKNIIKLQLISTSKNTENIKLEIQSENLNVELLNNESNEFDIKPKETKIIELNLIPTADGTGKLSINAFWIKEIQYKIKVQKIRENVPSNKFSNLLEYYHFQKKDFLEKFNPTDFIIELPKDEIKRFEKLIANSSGSQSEKIIIKLSKAYLNNKQLERALITANKLSKEKKRIHLIRDMIRAYSFVDSENSIKYIEKLPDSIDKSELLKTIALDHLYTNPDLAINIASKIMDFKEKKECFIEIIQRIVQEKPEVTLEISKFIQLESDLHTKIQFNIAESYWRKGNLEKSKEVLVRIAYLVKEKSDSDNYRFLRDAIYGLAEIDSPITAHNIIESINNQKLKERVAKDLFNDLYFLVEEIKTKIESKLINSFQHFLNTYSSNVNESIINFARKGGNLSLNTLSGDTTFRNLFIFLFNLNFSIFPFFERIYSDLKMNSNQSIAYYIFPCTENLSQPEFEILNSTLKFLIASKIRISNEFNIYNLDFIPYLNKPTIILGVDSSSIKQSLQNKLSRMKNKIDIIFDDSFFAGGKSKDYLNNIFESNIFKITNLVLSYEFINNYDLFKELVLNLM